MNGNDDLFHNVYWMLDCIQSFDIGIVAIDRDYTVQLWNRFMENHSGVKHDKIVSKNLFDVFPDLPREWIQRKAESVFSLKNRTYSTWEQRDYLFKFRNYHPITGGSPYMYQNIAFVPFQSADTSVRHIGILIYDVTDIAVSRMALEDANAQLRQLSRTDRLTGLNNRGYWEECLDREFRLARRSQQPRSVVMFDIDHFKKVNDTYGHPAGDEVIRQTAVRVTESIRATDIAGRYGGEEFSIILPDTDAEGAYVLADRLRERVAAAPVNHEDQSIEYTISLGVAAWHPDIQTHNDWIERADQALYQSKRGGRNRTTVFGT